jgi:hypothetical protein
MQMYKIQCILYNDIFANCIYYENHDIRDNRDNRANNFNIIGECVMSFISGTVGRNWTDADNAAGCGHLCLVNNFYNHRNILRRRRCTYVGANMAALNGHIDVLRYLHDVETLPSQNIIFNVISSDRATNYSSKNILEVVKFLLKYLDKQFIRQYMTAEVRYYLDKHGII